MGGSEPGAIELTDDAAGTVVAVTRSTFPDPDDPKVTVALRLDRDTAERLEAVSEAANCSRDDWANVALAFALDVDDGRRSHVPERVREAMPKRSGRSGISLPPGRIFDRPT